MTDPPKMSRLLHVTVLMLCAVPTVAQTVLIDPAARKDIDAGNQAWVSGMKQGASQGIAATYAETAVDCGPTGECIQGRAAIERHMRERAAKLGRAQSASVTSLGAVQQGDFVFEWGHADAQFQGGQKVSGRYLTVWQKQAEGGWKIFRNLSIPDDRK